MFSSHSGLPRSPRSPRSPRTLVSSKAIQSRMSTARNCVIQVTICCATQPHESRIPMTVICGWVLFMVVLMIARFYRNSEFHVKQTAFMKWRKPALRHIPKPVITTNSHTSHHCLLMSNRGSSLGSFCGNFVRTTRDMWTPPPIQTTHAHSERDRGWD